jgi:hypothetical protein
MLPTAVIAALAISVCGRCLQPSAALAGLLSYKFGWLLVDCSCLFLFVSVCFSGCLRSLQCCLQPLSLRLPLLMWFCHADAAYSCCLLLRLSLVYHCPFVSPVGFRFVFDAAYSCRCCACYLGIGSDAIGMLFSMLPTAIGAVLAIDRCCLQLSVLRLLSSCCFVVGLLFCYWGGAVLCCVATLPTGNAVLAVANPLLRS